MRAERRRERRMDLLDRKTGRADSSGFLSAGETFTSQAEPRFTLSLRLVLSANQRFPIGLFGWPTTKLWSHCAILQI